MVFRVPRLELSDWRAGLDKVSSANRPHGQQRRTDGPPLLFKTDSRMTLLIALVLEPGPIQVLNFWRAVDGHKPTALKALVHSGLVTTWTVRSVRNVARFYALDPAHPCATSIRSLLTKLAAEYAFEISPVLPNQVNPGHVPVRLSRRRDARLTFGDASMTLVLLVVYLLDQPNIADVQRVLSVFDRTVIARTLWQCHAFGIIEQGPKSKGGSDGIRFQLDPSFCAASELRDVLLQVSQALPVWTHAIAEFGKQPLLRKSRGRTSSKPKSSSSGLLAWSRAAVPGRRSDP